MRGLGLPDTCPALGLDGGACCGATGKGATVAVALVVAGVDADDEDSDWLRDTAMGPGEDHETGVGAAGSGDAECDRLLAGEERVECGEAPGRPLLAAAVGAAGGGGAGGTVELTSSWGEAAETSETATVLVAETARAAATGLSVPEQP